MPQPRLRSRRPRGHAPRAAAALLAALAAAMLALPAAGLRDAVGQERAEVTISLAPGTPGRPVPRSFLGLSFEASSAAQIATYADRGDFVRLLRSLGSGVLRFGGVSSDTQVAWSDARTPPPPWAGRLLGPADLQELRRLAIRSGWRILLTLGLAHYEPLRIAREAQSAHRILGRWLAGVEVGNEPDAYAHHSLRVPPWTPRAYEQEVSVYRQAIAHRVRGLALAGPGVSGSRAFARWGAAEARRQRPALLTGHHYPLRCDEVPPPSIEELLSEQVRALEAESLARYLVVAREHGLPFRMDETNTISCGGRPGISNAFASALWATAYITQAMTAGAAGINLQGNPANCGGYSPVCAPSAARVELGELQPQPEWYALLLTRELVGCRPLPLAIHTTAQANLAIGAVRCGDGTLKLVVVDDEAAGAPSAGVRVEAGGALRSGRLLALTAPAPGSLAGVRLGGRAVAADGSWRPGPRQAVAVTAGTAVFDVPAASAALLTLSSR
jgi:hypothetical protein